jgi:hypothetical protein
LPDSPGPAAPAGPRASVAIGTIAPVSTTDGHPLRRFLIAAAAWHFLWSVALVPYGIAGLVAVEGVEAARDWMASLPALAVWAAALAVVVLPLNLIAATLAFWLGTGSIGRRALIVAIFVFGWFDFGGLAAAAGGGFVIEAAIWGAIAGLVYGLVALRLTAVRALR